MEKIILVIIFLLVTNLVVAQYKPVDQGSSIRFVIQNLGFDVNGKFSGVDGEIKFDPQNPSGDTFDVTINAATVNTDNSLRDHHLQEDTYFDVKNYPKIHFVSTRIVSSNKNGAYIVTGKLTIKKQTRLISFPFTAAPSGDGYLFKGTFKLNRRDYDIGGISTISNELEMSLSILAKKK